MLAPTHEFARCCCDLLIEAGPRLALEAALKARQSRPATRRKADPKSRGKPSASVKAG
jgi:hypothetical protein